MSDTHIPPTQKPLSRYQTLIYGFAIFSMFFGSGNLVFPLQIGQESGSHWIFSFLGLFVTGIILPFLGLFVIKLHRGSYDSFFAEAGSAARLILPLFVLSLLGAFGVVPRCITVAHAGIIHIVPQLSLGLFALGFCVVSFFICLKDQLMITVLGKWMTPLLLVSLIILIVLGVLQAPAQLEAPSVSPQAVLRNGFLVGYQTMDLFAAFFFSALIFKKIQGNLPENTPNRVIIKTALIPSLMGAALLGLIYLGFVFLGAHYTGVIANLSPERLFPAIAVHVMGTHAGLLIGIVMLFSCLTTAVALNNIYARYLCELLKCDERRFPLFLFATTAASFAVSLLDFRGIAGFLAPVLEVSYPSFIALTLLCIWTQGHKALKISVFYGLLAWMVIALYF